MGKVMNYCKREDKTAYKQDDGREIQLISGKDCCGETAFKEFMATKKQYGKAHGTFYYQYVQSFSPDEKISPQQAHEVGLKFAEYFECHEVLVTTHMDNQHIHSHLLINSVNFENGKKLQMARGSIYKLRDFSDDICREHNLSIVVPKEKEVKGMNTREYRAALKGDSWKFKIMNSIDNAMANSSSKSEFIAKMQEMNYQVKWENNRKYITYTTPDNKKCRDNKLHDEKYLKQNMEEFYEHRAFKGFEQAGKSNRKLSNRSPVLWASARSVGTNPNNVGVNRTRASADSRENIAASDLGEHSRNAISAVDGKQSNLRSKRRESGKTNYINNRKQNGITKIGDSQGNRKSVKEYGKTPDRKGFKSLETESEVDRNRSVNADGIVRIANDIQNIVTPKPLNLELNQRELEQKPQIQKRQKPRDRGMEL